MSATNITFMLRSRVWHCSQHHVYMFMLPFLKIQSNNLHDSYTARLKKSTNKLLAAVEKVLKALFTPFLVAFPVIDLRITMHKSEKHKLGPK